VVEFLPSKHEALFSNHRMVKWENNEGENFCLLISLLTKHAHKKVNMRLMRHSVQEKKKRQMPKKDSESR
jgi:hypothetical protein